MKKKWSLLIGIFFTSIFIFLSFLKPYPLEILTLKFYDLLFRLKGKEKFSSHVVIAAIDEKSIQKLGRWPWSRDKLANLVLKLKKYQASLIVFDIILSERSPQDNKLKQAIERAGNVLLPVVFSFKKGEYPKTKEEEFLLDSAIPVIHEERFKNYPPISAKGVLMPIQKLTEVALSLGHINIFPDKDGTLRWESLVIEYNGIFVPSITLKAAAYYQGIFEDQMVIDATRSIKIGNFFIPTDHWGRILIYYFGSINSFDYIPIIDILEGKVDKNQIKNKIVLVGATAVGLYDLRVTPLSPVLPGVEKHANVIESILQHKFLKKVPHVYSILVIVFIGILSVLFSSYTKSLYSFLLNFGLFGTLTTISCILFVYHRTWFDPVYPSINLGLIFISTISYNYIRSEKKAREIRKIFASYVTERVVNQLVQNPSLARLGGERREVTVLFSDIRGFTSLSEKMPPEEVVELLNEYFAEMVDVIFKWEGTLDKFIGDAIMVFWGAPLPQEDHGKRAVMCAVEMVQRLKKLHEKWTKTSRPLLFCGIGINSGEVLVGNIGAEGKKMDYTVIGDHVNLASRIEGLTKKFNASILISEYTLKVVEDSVKKGLCGPLYIECVGNIAVKGKTKPVKIYKVEKKSSGPAEIYEPEDIEVIVMKEK